MDQIHDTTARIQGTAAADFWDALAMVRRRLPRVERLLAGGQYPDALTADELRFVRWEFVQMTYLLDYCVNVIAHAVDELDTVNIVREFVQEMLAEHERRQATGEADAD